MKRIILIIALLVFSFGFKAVGQSVWTIGPMLHYNFGGEKKTFFICNGTCLLEYKKCSLQH
jgi:hypothetical protein